MDQEFFYQLKPQPPWVFRNHWGRRNDDEEMRRGRDNIVLRVSMFLWLLEKRPGLTPPPPHHGLKTHTIDHGWQPMSILRLFTSEHQKYTERGTQKFLCISAKTTWWPGQVIKQPNMYNVKSQTHCRIDWSRNLWNHWTDYNENWYTDFINVIGRSLRNCFETFCSWSWPPKHVLL